MLIQAPQPIAPIKIYNELQNNKNALSAFTSGGTWRSNRYNIESPTMSPGNGNGRCYDAGALGLLPSVPDIDNDDNFQGIATFTMKKTVTFADNLVSETREFDPDDTVISISSSKQPSIVAWLIDERLMKSKVFQTRVNRDATKIQRIIRGATQRMRFKQQMMEFRYQRYAITIQKLVRGTIQRIEYQQIKTTFRAATQIQARIRGWSMRMHQTKFRAASRIQAHIRGWRTRMHHSIDQLSKELEQIEQRRMGELSEIEQRKQLAMQSIRDSNNLIEIQERKQREAFEDLNTMIRDIRAENKQLREELDEMSSIGPELSKQNFELQRSTNNMNYKIRDLQRNIIPKLEKEVKLWADTCRRFRDKYEEYVAFSERSDESMETSKTIRHMYQDKIQEIIYLIADKSTDMELRQKVASLCEVNSQNQQSSVRKLEVKE